MTRILAPVAVAAVFIAVAAIGVGATLRHRHRPAVIEGTLQRRTVFAVTRFGGKVLQVRVREGDAVQQGQTILSFDNTELRERYEQMRRAMQIVERQLRTQSSAAMLSAAAKRWLLHANPRVVEAEQRYVRILQDYESLQKGGSAGTEDLRQAQHDLDRAAADRVTAQAEAAHMLASLDDDRRDSYALLRQGKYALSRLEEIIAEGEVKAPSAGIIDLLKIRAGDVIPPATGIGAIVLPGEYYIEAHVPEDLAAVLQTQPLGDGRIGGVRAHARLESLGDPDPRQFGMRKSPQTRAVTIALSGVPPGTASGARIQLAIQTP